VFQVDPSTGSKHSIRLPGAPGSLAWSGGYGDVWITAFDYGSITRLHAQNGALETTESIATNPGSVVVDGSDVWVADWSEPAVDRLAAVGPTRPTAISLPVQGTGCPEVSCVWRVAAGAGFIWATTPEDDALWRIDPKTNAVTRIPLPYPPTGVTGDANDVWVTVRSR
jgi:streptogramin lyase